MTRSDALAAPAWLDVSRETLAQFGRFVALVEKWNPVINLVSKASLPDLWSRHLLDSAQLYALVPQTAQRLADLGSGGGFPGLVLAILARDARPSLHVTLIEADRRKSVFLSEAVRHLALNSTVMSERIEILAPLQADVVTARALAPLSALCGYAHRHLAPGGVALFAKGAHAGDELAEAQRHWRFTLTRADSKSDEKSSILILRDLKNV